MPVGERVVAVLRDRILEGVLTPGAPLRDVALSAELGVARHTLRMALRLLEYEGLVVYRMHRGAVVKTLSPEDVQELYRVRRIVELGAIDHSALATSGQLMELEAVVRSEERAGAKKDWNGGGYRESALPPGTEPFPVAASWVA